MPRADAATLLGNWERLNQELMSDKMNADAVRRLIEAEVAGQARPAFLLRLHSRFNKLRAADERRALASGKLPWPASLQS